MESIPPLERGKGVCKNHLGMIYLLTPNVILSIAKDLEDINEDVHVVVLEILPPFGRLNDTNGKL